MSQASQAFSWKAFLLSLLQLRPGVWRWKVSAEAALTVGIPLLLFTLVGAMELGIICSLGVFTVIYFSDRPRRERLAGMLPIAACLWLAAAIGMATAASLPLSILSLIGIAMVACYLVLGFRIGPPGPMMFVLVAGVTGHITAPASLGGAGVNGWLVLSMVAIGCLTSIVVVSLPLLIRPDRYRNAPAPTRTFAGFGFDSSRSRIMQRVVLGVVIASLFSYALGVQRAYWVILACIAILQSHPELGYTVARAVQRSFGTLLGVGLFWLLTLAQPEGLWLVLVICLLQLGIELFITRNYALGLLFITPLALTITTSSSTAPVGMIIGLRVIDTLLGAAIALGVLFGLEWWHSSCLRHRLRS